jgi:hypothetical protein
MSDASSSKRPVPPLWLPLILMLSVLVLRVLQQHHLLGGNLVNFSPMMAFAFAGTVVFPKPLPWWSWVLLLLGVDWLSEGSGWWSQANGHWEVLLAYGCYALAAFWGARLRGRACVLDTIVGTLACSVMFYVVTNTLSWWIDPIYAKSTGGWIQALTTGEPGVPITTLVFFRNSLMADLCGCVVLLAIYNGEAMLRRLRTMPWVGWSKATASA